MVSEDCLKLTTYFGERDRTSAGLLGDELMRICGEHRLQASMLMRGVEGFGRLHRLRTDRLLSLSEDLPVVAVAVDRRERIETLLQAALPLTQRGLITLERARMLTGEVRSIELPDQLEEATKLTVYVGRRERVGRTPAFVAVCELLRNRQIAGASVLLGVDGTRAGTRARARFFAANVDVPMMVIAVGAGEQIAQALPEITAMLQQPLITLERVRICKRDGELLEEPQELPGNDEKGRALWQKLTVYSSQNTTHRDMPLHLAIVTALRESDSAGATCLPGVWGFHGDHAPHGDRVFQLRRHIPICTIVIDAPERIAHAFQVIDEITREHGLVTSEMVPAMSAGTGRSRSGGLGLADHAY